MGLAQRDIRDFQWENGTKDWSPSCESKGGGGHGWRRKHLCRVVVVATQAGGVKTIELRVRGTDA